MAAFASEALGAVKQGLGISRPWTDGLCDCGNDTDACLDVFFCTPCQMSRQCMAIDGAPDSMDCCYCFCSFSAMYYSGFMFGVIAGIIRYRLIEKYRISGEGAIKTFCNSMWCPWCSLCQTSRELHIVGSQPGGTCCIPNTQPKMM